MEDQQHRPYLSVPAVPLAVPRVIDRTADLGVAILYLDDLGIGQIQITHAPHAREYAAAFTRAAEMLEAPRHPGTHPCPCCTQGITLAGNACLFCDGTGRVEDAPRS